MSMFCFQCQETAKNQGCAVMGVCGKNEEVANLQDLIIYLLKGLSIWTKRARDLGIGDEDAGIFIAKALFTTLTNVNFDPDRMIVIIEETFKYREKVKGLFLSEYKKKNGKDFNEDLHDSANWFIKGGREDYLKKASLIGILSEKDPAIKSLRWTIIYGLKGVGAYTDHAYILGYSDNDIFDFIQDALVATTDDSLNTDDLVGLVLKTGEHAVKAMALLDKANTERFGHPEITQVFTGTVSGPAILVSGHDLLDFEELLKQTEGKGIDVYTHGEMLPAHAYPAFKKYSHLKGNFGMSWWAQNKEFPEFNGAILITTNCLTKPQDSYKDRLFTTGLVGWPGIKHIPDRENGKQKDFSPVIKKALELSIKEIPGKKITIGFAYNSAFANLDKIVDAVKSGAIKRFIVMSGCDGRFPARDYYTRVAQQLPKDTVILTSGCAKYRYNMLDLGDINGIPRVLDAGQCNDSYSVVLIAKKLAEVFNVKDINELPVSLDIAWYEQKAVCIFLGLLYLGIKGIRIGPTLPAFLSPEVLEIIIKNFNVKLITNPEEDIKNMLEGK